MGRRRRQRNPTTSDWIGFSFAALAFGTAAYIVVRTFLAEEPKPQPIPEPQPEPSSPPTPTPTPTPTPPRPRPDLCDPLSPESWPAGKICAHDGERFVYVQAEEEPPPPLPQYETQCSFTVEEDHAIPHGGTKDPLEETSTYGLDSAVLHDKDGVIFTIGKGDWDNHTHAVVLDAAQIDTLRAGSSVYVLSSHEGGHNHPVVIRCATYEV